MSESGSTRVFGVRVGGVALALPPGEMLEYVADAPVYPLPLVGRRVLGLMQLRGHPIVVVDPQSQQQRVRETLVRRQVLVIGSAADGGALCVDGPPVVLAPGSVVHCAVRPDCSFCGVLDEALACVPDEPGEPGEPGRAPAARTALWWRFDPRRLFAVLAGE